MAQVTIYKAAIYARVSTPGQAKYGYSLESQIEESRRFCAQRELQVAMEDFDQITGSAPIEHRPGLSRIWDQVVAGEINALVFHSVDRVGREDVVTVEILARMEAYGVRIFYVKEGCEHGDITEWILIGMAHKERKDIAERTSRGRRTKAGKGRYVGAGRIAFGYRYDGEGALVVQAEEATTVRQIFAWYAVEWASIREIERRLTKAAVKTHRGNTRWRHSSIKRILDNETYIGRAYYNRRVHNPRKKSQVTFRPEDEWIMVPVPPLIDEETWEVTRYRRTHQRRAVRRQPHHDYLLRGMLFCAECERAYVGEPCKGYLYYRDGGRIHRMVRVELVEERIWQAIARMLMNPSILWVGYEAQGEEAMKLQARMQEHLQGVVAALEKAVATKRKLLDRFIDPEVNMDKQEYLEKRAELDAEIEHLEGRAAELRQRVGQIAVTKEQMLSIQEFARKAAQGIANISFAGKREILQKLRVRGLIHHDSDGAWVELTGLFPVERVGLLDTTS